MFTSSLIRRSHLKLVDEETVEMKAAFKLQFVGRTNAFAGYYIAHCSPMEIAYSEFTPLVIVTSRRVASFQIARTRPKLRHVRVTTRRYVSNVLMF